MATDLPPMANSMVQFAFWASLCLTILKIVELIVRAARTPKLDLQLTRDVFFRLTDNGEGLFANPVLLASNGPVLITDVRAVLKRTDSPEKSFPLKVLAYGEKVRGTGPFADHYFHSRSPISHIPESVPQRAVYFCIQEEYHDQSMQAVAEFRKKLYDFKADLLTKAGSQFGSLAQEEVVKAVNVIVEASLTKMMDLVQLEPGCYQLTVAVSYRPASRSWASTSTAQSDVTFVVAKDVRDHFRSALRQTLIVSAANVILDQNQTVLYPEYQPLEMEAKSSSPS